MHKSVKDGHICFVEGVYRQLTDTSTKIGTRIKNWDKHGCLHKLTTVEQALMKQLDTKYGPPFSIIRGHNYSGFWKTEGVGGGVDSQIVAATKERGYLIVSSDNSIHGACMLEDVEYIRYEEFGRRLLAGTLVQSKLF